MMTKKMKDKQERRSEIAAPIQKMTSGHQETEFEDTINDRESSIFQQNQS